MASAPLLALPNFSKEFTIEADASQSGIGAVFSQCGKPMAYFSKALSPKHQLLSVYEKKMLALLVAVKKWSSYVIGRHFKIRTDHHSLKFLLDQRTHTPAQQQWILKMMSFDYEVCYRKGVTNKVDDALSRKFALLQVITSLHTDLLDRIRHFWFQDPALVHRI